MNIKLTPREKKRLIKRQKNAKALAKAKESIEPELHPFQTMKDKANEYSQETQQNYKKIVEPPQYTREDSFKHMEHKADNMNIFSKVWTCIWVGALIIFILFGLIAMF